jgi:hypothetical protein
MGSVVRFKPDLKPKIEMYYGFKEYESRYFFVFSVPVFFSFSVQSSVFMLELSLGYRSIRFF